VVEEGMAGDRSGQNDQNAVNNGWKTDKSKHDFGKLPSH
jgi:hypothetical protein